jgi:hypothetical protein
VIDVKGKLIKISAELIDSCPISFAVEDLNLSKKTSKKTLDILVKKLDDLTSWRLDIAISIRDIADNIKKETK